MSKINAKKEFLDITKGFNVIAAKISFGDEDHDYDFNLKPSYTINEYNDFMKFLNRNYDSGYGSQNLFGIIFCENGVWMTRGEYDGAEWWNVHKYPNLKDFFNESDVIKYERSSKIKKIEQKDSHD